jgi:integrase
MPLTEIAIKALKARDKSYSVADSKGLCLQITPSGSKLWRYRYRYLGKARVLALGEHPAVSLADARDKRDEARLQLRNDIDPGALRQQTKLIATLGSGNTFGAIAEEFIEKKFCKEGRADQTVTKTRWQLTKFKSIAKRPIAEIKPQEILAALLPLQNAGHHETAKRCRAFASRVFRYAVATGRAENDPALLLSEAMVTPTVSHHAALLDPADVGRLLRDIDGYAGSIITRLALQLAPHLLARPGELRQARWEEFDLDAGIWRMTAHRMKARRAHAVPLSSQVLAYLAELAALTGPEGYLFPANGKPNVPMSENTMNQGLKRLGYTSAEVTPHGLRTTGSTLLNESGKWHPDAIERALAHGDSDVVRGIYNRGQYWEERVRMMQWWSDYLDQLRKGGEIVPLFRKVVGGG